ncbi:MAG: hypothetical protein C4532_00345 [Candidatus Abyssobacteria bacterium SURF_17]|uniref:Uncharacterized protein n=1 Tax=Candidatus Abyssobacteria bacterium SURF_17 TaxID=2093361 RepID=A0A419F9S1_9BACT|nr:MAG: hypothetical protein C4532_00345 [Candidatus Abyssubacteria bacterium SURF_17]
MTHRDASPKQAKDEGGRRPMAKGDTELIDWKEVVKYSDSASCEFVTQVTHLFVFFLQKCG